MRADRNIYRSASLSILTVALVVTAPGAQAHAANSPPSAPLGPKPGDSPLLAAATGIPEDFLLPVPWLALAPRDRATGRGDGGLAATESARPPLPAPAFGIQRINATTTQFHAPDQGIAARFELAAGAGVFRPGQLLLGGSLSARNSWRREVAFSIAPPGLQDIGLTLTAGAYSGRRPMQGGRGIRHGVGDLSRWQATNTWDLGLKFELPNSGIRYAGGLSWSEYSLETATRNDYREKVLSPRQQWRRGRSHWHKLEADLWKNDRGSASAYAIYGAMDANYRSYRRNNESPLVFGGRTFELGGEVRQGKAKLTVSHQSVAGEEVSLHETNSRLRMGPVDLRLEVGDWSLRSPDLPGWSATDRYWKARVRLSLRGDLEAGGGKGLLPDWASLRAGRTESRDMLSGTQTAKFRTSQGFGLGWSRQGSETEITLSRTITSQPGATALGPSREQEFALDFNQTFSRDWWDLSIYGSISSQRSPQSSNKLLSGGASFSIDRKDLPKLSLGFDLNRYELRSPEFGLSNQDIGFNASLDLSRYLPPARGGHKPYLLLKAYSNWSASRDSFSPYEKRTEPTVMLVFGTNF